MPTPPSTTNYKVGGIRVVLGGLDLGNVVSFGIDPTGLELLQHFTARSGARKVDKQVVTQKRLVFTVELDEHAAVLYQRYFMGSLAGQTVAALTNPLAETNGVITYLDESGTIWSYSHTRLVARPSGEMDYGSFDDWVTFELEIEALEDTGQPSAPLGAFTFTS